MSNARSEEDLRLRSVTLEKGYMDAFRRARFEGVNI